ncbi:MAG: c-type cytochrome [Burkholderiales bacterium]|nr:c-type cytochrome [Ferrovum sp.]
MKQITKILTLSAVALTLGACSTNLDRSRSLGNPQVTGHTLAQQVCSICHGDVGSNVNGNSVNPTFPILAGQQAVYLEAEMQEFHEHTRRDKAAQDMMWGIARDFTPEQIKQLAEYFSKQTPMPNPAAADADPTMVAAGQKIFTEGNLEKAVPPCAACHGANAEGNGPIPRLAGQHADYLYKQLMVFNDDAQSEEEHEKNPAVKEDLERPHGVAMEGIAHGLSDQQKHDVALYLQSLK